MSEFVVEVFNPLGRTVQNRRIAPQQDFVLYDEEGRITLAGREAIGLVEDRIAAGEPVLMLDRPAHLKMWVDAAAGVAYDLEPCTATLSGQTLSGLPVPSTVEVDGEVYQVTDGVAEFTFTQPGVYTVTVRSPRCLPTTYEITHG